MAHARENAAFRNIPLGEAEENRDISVNSPGIYVYWREDLGVIKVGKHQINSKKRALEHIRDGTNNQQFDMRTLQGDKGARLILFNLSDPTAMHWLSSIEAFIETNTLPIIPSQRRG